jgi:hypothetical protein
MKPKHYDMSIPPVEFIVANDIPFLEANVIKYVCRHKQKGGKEDILKAIEYLQYIIKDQYTDESNILPDPLRQERATSCNPTDGIRSNQGGPVENHD